MRHHRIAAGLVAGLLFASAASAIDVVFIIDESGSMGDDQSDVQANANNIFAGLPPGSHAAVVGYGSSRSGHGSSQQSHLHQPMTANPATFAAGVGALTASGSIERGWRATLDAATDVVPGGSLNYTGDPVCHILITDERPAQGGVTVAQATAALVAQPGIFFGVFPTTYHAASQIAATSTGGALFDLGAFRNSPQAVLDAVVAACVEAAIPVALDIKPTSCPNPHKLGKEGVLPVALLSSDEFDATSIVPDSLVLNGECAVLRTAVEDVATPFDGERTDPVQEGQCTTAGADGLDDLTAKFDSECASGTTELTDREAELWEVCGEYINGDGQTVEFCASDVVRVMP